MSYGVKQRDTQLLQLIQSAYPVIHEKKIISLDTSGISFSFQQNTVTLYRHRSWLLSPLFVIREKKLKEVCFKWVLRCSYWSDFVGWNTGYSYTARFSLNFPEFFFLLVRLQLKPR